MSINLFSPDGVAANKRGEITSEQCAPFRAMQNWVRCLLYIFSGVGVLVALLFMLSPGTVPIYGISIGGGIALAYLLWVALRARRIQLELDEGQIERATGIVQKQNYIALPQNRKLKSIYPLETPAPGEYQFFFLPKSGWLLSAERLTSDETAIRNMQKALASKGLFDPAWLPVNQQGVLAQGQSKRLLRLALLHIARVVIGCGLLAALIYLSGMATNGQLCLGLIALSFVGLGIYSLSYLLEVLGDIKSNVVAAAEGVLHETFVGGRPIAYYLTLRKNSVNLADEE